MNFCVELSVTEKCNLGCPYCYVANRDQFMTRETLDQVLDDIEHYASKARCTDVMISYFGGEPLLNWDLIKYSIPKVKARGWSQNIISSMTLITREIAHYCQEHGVGFSWSFDGIDANSSRPLLRIPENQGYKKILDLYNSKKDLLLELCHGCKVMIYPGNFRKMTENLDFLLDWGIPNPDFTLVRDAIWAEGDVEEFKHEARRLADRWMEHLRAGRRCGVGFFILYIPDTIIGVMYGKRTFGCFACTKGASVKSNGDFYPCARFASKGLLKYSKDHDFKYYNDLLNPCNYDKCRNCDLYRICNAGCTYSQLREGNKPVPAVCDLYHILYAEAARVTHLMKDNPVFQDMIATSIAHGGKG